ncbi:salivary anticoagulant protein P23 [Rhipicephalus microplus]|uniref:salivary anticoagulant protein P23 n=1 Tax=Rhipicephalus microplus TaxID=6941 RepID=UPI003F6B2218
MLSSTMLKFCVLALATVSCVSSADVNDANTFIDIILKEKVPSLVKESPQLYPYATIEDFSFKVPNNRITNRELKVKMTRGEVRGLETALQRFGDCQVPLLRDEQTVIVCNLTMQGVNVTFSSLVDGDSLFSGWKTIWVNVNVTDGLTRIEAKFPVGRTGGTLGAELNRDLQLDVTYDSNLSLNKGRLEKFKHEIKAKVKKELYPMYSEYVSLLRRAVSLSAYPRA